MALPAFNEWPSTPTDEIGEDRWENEGGAPLPDRTWVRIRRVRDDYVRSLCDSIAEHLTLGKEQLQSMFGGPMHTGKGGGVVVPGVHFTDGHVKGFYPYRFGADAFKHEATITGRWKGRNPPEDFEALRVRYTPILDIDYSEIEKRVVAAHMTDYKGDVGLEHSLQQALSLGKVSAKELRSAMRHMWLRDMRTKFSAVWSWVCNVWRR